MAKKKETSTNNISITPKFMWMGCGYRAHLMGDSTDSRLVIILPGGTEAIVIPKATAKQWEKKISCNKKTVKNKSKEMK